MVPCFKWTSMMTGQVHLRGPGGGFAMKEDNDTLLQVELNDDRAGTFTGAGRGFCYEGR